MFDGRDVLFRIIYLFILFYSGQIQQEHTKKMNNEEVTFCKNGPETASCVCKKKKIKIDIKTDR